MADLQITCITKSSLLGDHEYISHAGNPAVNWWWTVNQIISAIDNNQHTFFVLDQYGRRANVGVVRAQGRRPHIRTYADGVWTDNLLSLNSCPWKAA